MIRRELICDGSLSPAARLVALYLLEGGARRKPALVAELNLGPSTVQTALKHLRGRGLIHTEMVPDGSRGGWYAEYSLR